MSPLTEEQKKDISDRKSAFLSDYDALSKKYQMEQVSGPVLTTIGQNLFAITMISDIRDTKYLGTPSPMQSDGSLLV